MLFRQFLEKKKKRGNLEGKFKLQNPGLGPSVVLSVRHFDEVRVHRIKPGRLDYNELEVIMKEACNTIRAAKDIKEQIKWHFSSRDLKN